MDVRDQIRRLWIRIEELRDVLAVVVPGDQSATVVVEVPDLELLMLGSVDQLTA